MKIVKLLSGSSKIILEDNQSSLDSREIPVDCKTINTTTGTKNKVWERMKLT